MAPATTRTSRSFPRAPPSAAAPPVNTAGCGCVPLAPASPSGPVALAAAAPAAAAPPAATPLGPTVAVAKRVAVPPPTPTVTKAVAVAVPPPPRVTVVAVLVACWLVARLAEEEEEAAAVGTMALARGICAATPPRTCLAGVFAETEAALLA